MSDQSGQPPERPSGWERPGSAPPPPPPPPPPYQQPPPGYAPYGQPGYPSSPGTNGFAIASMVLGILWLWWIGSILALVFGYVAKSQIRGSGQSGSGMATAGIVLGWIGVGFLALFITIGIIDAATT
jgi:hypothetical protein